MLPAIAVRCVRTLGTPGVQLWDPGRAIVCFTLSDLGSVEGCGGDGLPVREKRGEVLGSVETLDQEVPARMVGQSEEKDA